MDSDVSDFRNIFQGQDFKQIEDVIDARKRLGQYNVHKPTTSVNIKCVYSSFQTGTSRKLKFDEASVPNTNERDMGMNGGIRHTDSEITIVKVKCTGAVLNKRKPNKWDMNDIAIPGDGTHLGESPSLVNLVTLVTQNVQCEGDDEYLVPLSSWDPLVKIDEIVTDMRCSSETKMLEKPILRCSNTDPNLPLKQENLSEFTKTDTINFEEQTHRNCWAGKISKFWRKHWLKSKSPAESQAKINDGD